MVCRLLRFAVAETMPTELRVAVDAIVGPIASVTVLGRATQADVWRVVPHRGATVVVKRHRDAASFRAERVVYDGWGTTLTQFTPRLITTVTAPANALVIEWVDGRRGDDPDLPAPLRLSLHRQAGEFCRALAEHPCPDQDPMPLHEALRTRMDSWCRRGAGRLPAATLREAAATFDETLFVGVRRVFAHRDFAPWNWIAGQDPALRLAVIDFGHARADAPLTDLLKLADGPWVDHPAARDAFFEGFGRTLSDLEEARLRSLLLLHGIASAVWGREHGAPPYAAIGDAVLGRLLSGG